VRRIQCDSFHLIVPTNRGWAAAKIADMTVRRAQGRQRSTHRPLSVAIVAPPWYDIPPKGYGGIEAMCAGLADGLVSLGADVTVIAAGANGTTATLLSTFDEPQYTRLGDTLADAVHAAALPRMLAELGVDIVHDHSLLGPLVAATREAPTVVTAHGPVTGELGRYYCDLGSMVNLVAISQAQRGFAPQLNWAGVVHNAIEVRDFPFEEQKSGFALFLGRTSPDKGILHAVHAAKRAGIELVIAAKSNEPSEREYFESAIEPVLGPRMHWVGEADASLKRELLKAARCLLFPICWEEPFGMVMIEALACGTPVVALGRGSVPEIIRDGKTGIVCGEPDDLPDALHRVQEIEPADCRADALNRFDVSRMSSDYFDLYHLIVDDRLHRSA
jgi:glycosyltransferase involved in cell wall biosynthesis